MVVVPFRLLTKFAKLYQHTNALLWYTNIESFPVMQRRSITEKMTFSLLVYGLAITPVSGNTLTDLIHLKIRSS